MVFVEEGEEILEAKEVLLLKNLSINVRRSQGFDLHNEKVTDTFNCLNWSVMLSWEASGYSYLLRQLFQKGAKIF